MIFIEDILTLPEEFGNIFTPRPYTKPEDVSCLCVYAYLREQADDHGPKGSVYYIGEGVASRPISVHDNVHTPVIENIIIVSDKHPYKRESLNAEAVLIHYFGRIINGTGILENVHPGSPRLFPALTRVIADSRKSTSQRPVIRERKSHRCSMPVDTTVTSHSSVDLQKFIPDSEDWDFL